MRIIILVSYSGEWDLDDFYKMIVSKDVGQALTLNFLEKNGQFVVKWSDKARTAAKCTQMKTHLESVVKTLVFHF